MTKFGTPRPYYPAPAHVSRLTGKLLPPINIPLGFAAHGLINKRTVSGTLHKVPHTVGSITRISTYYTDRVVDVTTAIIYRVRRGNGFYGAKLGTRIQDQAKYGVPWPLGNPAAAASRAVFATAVSNWQSVLTEDQKIAYNKRSTHSMHMSGYNLYIREYMRANT